MAMLLTPGMLQELNESDTRLSEVTRSASTTGTQTEPKEKAAPVGGLVAPDPERTTVPVGGFAVGEEPAMSAAAPATAPESGKKQKKPRERKPRDKKKGPEAAKARADGGDAKANNGRGAKAAPPAESPKHFAFSAFQISPEPTALPKPSMMTKR